MSSRASSKNNGYAPSLFPEIEETEYTCRHEIFGGPNRHWSKEWGCWLPVLPEVHELLHQRGEEDRELKEECQKRFEKLYGHDAFMRIFGRNYICR